MALYAIGDIHGCWTALETLLSQVRLQADDQLVLLGDYVDRGPDSERVLSWVIDQAEQERCIPLRGNHEVMMLAVLEGQMSYRQWAGCGGEETLRSYFPRERRFVPNLEVISPTHWMFLKYRLVPYHETETHIFVHAAIEADYELADQDEHVLYWDRFDRMRPHLSGKRVICGHTAQKSGVPADHGHAVCIDTWVYGAGWLTCLNVETGQYWQANQQGKTRQGQLAPQSGES